MSDRDTLSEALDLLIDPFDEEPDGWQAVLEDATSAGPLGPGLRRRVPALSLRLRVGLVGAGVAAALALIVASPWDRGPAPISAAEGAVILKRTQAALAFRPGRVLHLRTQTTFVLIPVSRTNRKVYERVRTESWSRTARRYDSRSLLTYGSHRLESGLTFEPCGLYYFDSGTGALYRDNRFPPTPCGSGGFSDPAASIRRNLAAGKLEVVGRATIRGRSVYRIQESRKYWLVDRDTTILYVDAHSYQPVRIESEEPGALASARYRTIREIRDVLAWEYLPATSANLALTDIREMHPDARIASLDAMPAGPTRDLVFSVGSGGVPSVP
jgi:hypothetical protein